MNRHAIAVLALLGFTVAASQTPPAAPPPTSGETGQITVDGRPDAPRYPLFVSPMGEPFRGGEHPEEVWFAAADKNHDGQISRNEFIADAMRFFATLDVDHNHEIGPTEIDRYERDIVPEAGTGDGGGFGDGGGGPPAGGRPGGGPGGGGRRGGGMGGGGMGGGPGGGMGGGGGGMGGGGGRHGGGGGGDGPPEGGGSGGPTGGYMYRASGAGRFGYIATPEPVTAADTDLNRSVSEKEWVDAAARRFALLDANGDGVITAKELPKLANQRFGAGRRGKGDKKWKGRDGGPPPPPPSDS